MLSVFAKNKKAIINTAHKTPADDSRPGHIIHKGSSFTCSIAESGKICFFRERECQKDTAPAAQGAAADSFFCIHPRLSGTAVPTNVVLCCFAYRYTSPQFFLYQECMENSYYFHQYP